MPLQTKVNRYLAQGVPGAKATPDQSVYTPVNPLASKALPVGGFVFPVVEESVIDNTRASKYGYDQRTEVQCVGGCVQVSNDLENTAMISSAEGVSSAKPTWFFLERYNDAFVAEEQAFAGAVLNDTEVPVNGHDGLMPVAIAIAAKKSLDEGRAVKLSEVL